MGRDVASVDTHAGGNVDGVGAGAGVAMEIVAAEVSRHVPNPLFRGMAFAAFGGSEGLFRDRSGLDGLGEERRAEGNQEK